MKDHYQKHDATQQRRFLQRSIRVSQQSVNNTPRFGSSLDDDASAQYERSDQTLQFEPPGALEGKHQGISWAAQQVAGEFKESVVEADDDKGTSDDGMMIVRAPQNGSRPVTQVISPSVSR